MQIFPMQLHVLWTPCTAACGPLSNRKLWQSEQHTRDGSTGEEEDATQNWSVKNVFYGLPRHLCNRWCLTVSGHESIFTIIQEPNDIQKCVNVCLTSMHLWIDTKIIKFDLVVTDLWSFRVFGSPIIVQYHFYSDRHQDNQIWVDSYILMTIQCFRQTSWTPFWKKITFPGVQLLVC